MNFAIEVSGEAIPLTPADLCRVLQAATSSDYAARQSATKQLSAWESHQDYFVGLQTVFLDKSLPRDIRFQSIIQLKNGIDKLWRTSAKHAMRPQQRNFIRSRIFQGSIDESDKHLALHNALVAAKVVRVDFPNEWPDALSSLVDMLRNLRQANQAHLHGVLLLLLRIVTELSTARLRHSQTALYALSAELALVAAEIYAEKTTIWADFLTKGKGDDNTADLAMQNTLTSLKLLRRLAVGGFEFPHKHTVVQQFWSLTQAHFGQFIGLVSHDSVVPAPYQTDIGKHLLQFTKLHVEMAETHPASFALLPNAIELCMSYWDLVAKFSDVFHSSMGIRSTTAADPDESAAPKSKMEGPLLERLALKGILLLKSCLRMVFWPQHTFRYLNQETRAERDTAIKCLKEGLLKDEFVIQMTNVIITNLFIFRQSDLEAWEEDPQDWEAREHSRGSAWEWEVRPAAERLFLDLLSNYKDLLVPPLLSYVQTATEPDSDIVTKEKLFASIGLAAAHLGSAFDFDALLVSTLATDAQKQGPQYKILRRRIAIVISQWAPVALADQRRPLVYEIFRHFLNPADPTNDIVVQLTAARELETVINYSPATMEGSFKAELFEPYAVDIVTHLLHLIDEAETDETKLAILSTLREIVVRMELHAKLFSDMVISKLPTMWDSTGSEEYMIKQAIMAILSSITMSLKSDATRYYDLVLPVLTQAIQPGSDLYIHLIEDSLELWEAVQLQCTRPMAPEVVALAEMAVALLENQTENVQNCLELVRNYILLTPETMLSDDLRIPTLRALFTSLDARGRDTIKLAKECIWMLIKEANDIGGSDGLAAIVKDMVSQGFIANIMKQIHEAWEASETTGPKRKPSKLSILTEIDYLQILGRVLLCDPKIFVMMLSELGNLEAVWKWLIPRWFADLDNMSNGETGKETCLALTRLLELPSPVQELVLCHLQDYFAMWTTVVTDCREGANNGEDAYVWPDMESEVLPTDTPKDIAERKVLARWETYYVDTWSFVTTRVQDLIVRVGGEEKFQRGWVVNVDGEVMAGFKQLSAPRTTEDGDGDSRS